MNRTKTTLTASLAVLFMVGLAVAPAPAAANPVSDILGDDDAGIMDYVDSVIGGAKGTAERIQSWSNRVAGDGPDVETEANETADVFNSNSAAIVDYVNARSTVDESHEVAKLTFELDGNEATRYLVGETSDGNYTSAEMVTPAEYENQGYTSSDVDETVTLSGYAAQNADVELDRFVRDFVADDRDLSADPSYRGELGGRYGGGIDASFEW